MLDLDQVSQERQAILERALRFYRNLPSVLGLFLGGSLATGGEDAFSDIDLRVVGDPGQFTALIQDRTLYPKAFGAWLFNEPGASSGQVCVSHFAPFNKLDVVYYRPQDLRPLPYFGAGIRILHDPQGLVGRVQDASRRLRQVFQGEALDNLCHQLYAFAHEAYRRMVRQEFLYAQSLMVAVKERLVLLDDIVGGRYVQRPASPLARCEQRLDGAFSRLLARSLDGADRAGQLAYLGQLCLEGQERIRQACAKHQWPPAFDGLAIIIEQCGADPAGPGFTRSSPR